MKYPPYVTPENLDHFISNALEEDIGEGDHSTLATLPPDLEQKAKLLVKEDCVLAGVDMAKEIFHYYDSHLELELLMEDGQEAKVGDIAFFVSGKAQSILTTERLALNCMQRMSGIATYTRNLANLITHTQAQILDTRKTTPNFRMCEKWAVYIGGGINHRYGLYDMVMLKDNHIDFNGSITKAVNMTYDYLQEKNLDLKIEVETRNLEEVNEALQTEKVDRIMLDNMSVDMMTEAVKFINKQCESEASGGITEETIVAVAETGVDYISLGAVTHSANNIDLSLKAT